MTKENQLQNLEILRFSLTNKYYLTTDEQNEILKENHLNTIDSNKNLKELLNEIEDKEILKKILISIENYEYKKLYMYRFLYDTPLTKKEILKKIKDNENIFNNREIDYYSQSLENPSLKITDEKITLKFSKVLTDKNNNRDKIKYPVLVDFFLQDNLFQIKFEMIENKYSSDYEKFYLDLANKIEKWIFINLGINFSINKTFDKAEEIIYDLNKNQIKDVDINEFLDYGRTAELGDIRLRVGQTDKIPLYGELRELKKEFCEKDQKIMEDFLQKLDFKIDRYKRGIEWKFETKASNGRVYESKLVLVFSNDYLNSGKTFVHIYHCKQNIKRREYAIKYVANHTKEKNE